MMFKRRGQLPDSLRTVLEPDERILASVSTDDERLLVASRFGLWIVADDDVVRFDWHLLSKVRLADGELHIVGATEVTRWTDGTAVLRDRTETTFHPTRPAKLTDVVHDRVRASVVASYHLAWPGAGGWVVLRKIAGRDGLAAQVRLDPGADPAADGFVGAVGSIRDQLWPAGVPRPGTASDPG